MAKSPIRNPKNNGKIVSFTTLSGKVFKGKVFIDATYEGDLMASSGVSYHIGERVQKPMMKNGMEFKLGFTSSTLVLGNISL